MTFTNYKYNYIMKRVFIALAIILSSATFYHSQAQVNHNSEWVMSVGLGYSSGETYEHGFAQGAGIAYRYNIFEFGFSFRHGFVQTPSSTKVHGLAFTQKGVSQSLQISQDKEGYFNYDSGHTTSLDLSIGVNPLKLIEGNERHNLIVSFIGGIGARNKSYLTDSEKGLTIETEQGTFWSYGPRVAYEYMLTDMIGLGLSATYDSGQSNFYGLVNLSVHF